MFDKDDHHISYWRTFLETHHHSTLTSDMARALAPRC